MQPQRGDHVVERAVGERQGSRRVLSLHEETAYELDVSSGVLAGEEWPR
jgi:hypothetical protein